VLDGTIAGVLLGAATGGAIGWLLAQVRARGGAVDLEARARTAEARAADLDRQLEARRVELDRHRAELIQAKADVVEAGTRLADLRQAFEEKRRLLDEAGARLADAFKALAADALRSNNQAFLQLARESIQPLQARTEGSLQTHRQSVEMLVKPLEEILRQYQGHLQELERSRKAEEGALTQHLKTLAEGHQRLQAETANLAGALRAPQGRGRWGELTLRRVAEVAGLSEFCDYAEQATVADEAGRLRPDLVVRLPGGRQIVVDAKVVFDAYDRAVEARTDDERRAHLAEHARQVRARVRALALKEYARQFETPPEFVVLFLPGESFFSAALLHDRSLIEDAAREGVVLATPTTLIALMKAVAYGWRQEQAAQNAGQIRALGLELHERVVKLAEHLQALGEALGESVEAYNRAIGAVETRVLSTARKFKALGADSGGELPTLGGVEGVPRRLAAPELASRQGVQAPERPPPDAR
jgi:DNA recombination protein RmuC